MTSKDDNFYESLKNRLDDINKTACKETETSNLTSDPLGLVDKCLTRLKGIALKAGSSDFYLEKALEEV